MGTHQNLHLNISGGSHMCSDLYALKNFQENTIGPGEKEGTYLHVYHAGQQTYRGIVYIPLKRMKLPDCTYKLQSEFTLFTTNTNAG